MTQQKIGSTLSQIVTTGTIVNRERMAFYQDLCSCPQEIVKNRISQSIRQKYECKRQKIVWNLYVTTEKVNFEIKSRYFSMCLGCCLVSFIDMFCFCFVLFFVTFQEFKISS